MKTVITGGGFIGSFLAAELIGHGNNVLVFGNEPVSDPRICFVEGDIRDFSALARAATHADVVFHLAGLLGTDYLCDKALEAVDVNIKGALNVFEIARRSGTKVINVGLVPDWDNSYMITKKAAARFGRMYRQEFNADITTVEITHVYGPRQKLHPYRKAIPTFITCAIRHQPIEIYGDGTQVMDCIYATDVAKCLALLACTRIQPPPVITLGSGHKSTVGEIANLIRKLAGSESAIIHLPMRSGEPGADDYAASVDAADFQRLVNWMPTTSISEGLQRTIAWYRDLSLGASA